MSTTPSPGNTGNAPSASAATVSLASLLPKESLKLDRFDGLPKDRKFCASWIRRCERIHLLLGYTSADWEQKLAFASASLPTTSPSGRWYDSKVSTPSESFKDWDDFKRRFLVRFGPTTADLNTWEQEFQRMTQSNQTVNEFVQAIDQARDILASSSRTFDDRVVRQIFVAGVRPSIRQHINSQIAVDNTLTYDRCVEISHSHADADIRSGPRCQGLNGQNPSKEQPSKRTGKYCAYHKVTTHSTEDCSVVRRLKAEGKWRGKPRADK
jgi:hypothetical protein